MFIPRHYSNLDKYLKPSEVLVIYGPRRVGKTTLVKKYLDITPFRFKIDTGDNIEVHHILGSMNLTKINEYISGYELYVIDEAQLVPGIGRALKLMIDNNPKLKVIATGSSSFELAGQIGEPLTGRKRTLTLYPISVSELLSIKNSMEIRQDLENLMIFGSYPAVLTAKTLQEKIVKLQELLQSYLLRDILTLESVKSSKVLLDLLRLIAFQVGQLVSLEELGRQVGLDRKTVARYLDLFEKSFIIYNLRGYGRNLRKEITKMGKYYFLDNGIRNVVIANLNDMDHRDDKGALWENFAISERIKIQNYDEMLSNNYFWRTWDQKEIDLVEERGGKLFGYEFTYSSQKAIKKHAPREWGEVYKNSSYTVVTPDDFFAFIGKK